jgi:hypothetical protein
MSTDNLSIHQTATQRLQVATGHVWEFVCPTCGYRAHYTEDAEEGRQHFKVVAQGDPQARHTNNPVPIEPFRLGPELYDDEPWLTPELRRQMEELLLDVDMDDWVI